MRLCCWNKIYIFASGLFIHLQQRRPQMMTFFHLLTYNKHPLEKCKLWRKPNKTYGKFISNFKCSKTKIVHGTFTGMGCFWMFMSVCNWASLMASLLTFGFGWMLLDIPLTYLHVYTYTYYFNLSSSFFLPQSFLCSSFQFQSRGTGNGQVIADRSPASATACLPSRHTVTLSVFPLCP